MGWRTHQVSPEPLLCVGLSLGNTQDAIPLKAGRHLEGHMLFISFPSVKINHISDRHLYFVFSLLNSEDKLESVR